MEKYVILEYDDGKSLTHRDSPVKGCTRRGRRSGFYLHWGNKGKAMPIEYMKVSELQKMEDLLNEIVTDRITE
jgi:hypothetical protein